MTDTSIQKSAESDMRTEAEAATSSTDTFDTRPPRLRSPWLVAGLTFATLGIYLIIWLGLTWSELKRELRDEKMRPFWHAVAMFIPLYGFFRFHAHYRLTNQLLESTRSEQRVYPYAALIAIISGSLLVVIQTTDPVLLVVNPMAAVGLQAWAAYHGQEGLNAYWETQRNRAEPKPASILERLVLGFGIGVWISFLLTAFIGVPAA